MKKRLKEIKQKLHDMLVALGQVSTDKGILSYDGDEDLKAGDAVKVVGEDGALSDAPDGDYTTEDGKVIAVVDGKVASISDPKSEVAPQANEVENPDGRGGESDAEAIRGIRKEIDELYDILDKVLTAVGKDREDVANLRAELDAIRKTPADKTAHETYNEEQPSGRTGDKTADKTAEMLGYRAIQRK